VLITINPARGAGLWHGVFAAMYVGMQAVFTAPGVPRESGVRWLQAATTLGASVVLADHDVLAATEPSLTEKALRHVRLHRLRQLVVCAEGPSSTATFDFAKKLRVAGLDSNAVVPALGTMQAGPISFRSPQMAPQYLTLSLRALSFGVVRPSAHDSDATEIADAGIVVPGGALAIVSLDSAAVAREDEIGEIVLSHPGTGRAYWGLAAKTQRTFQMTPISDGTVDVPAGQYVRTGLVGFILRGREGDQPPGSGVGYPDGVGSSARLFVTGTRRGLLRVDGRLHNEADVLETVCRGAGAYDVELFKSRVAFFTVSVVGHDRLVCVLEVAHDAFASSDEANAAMARLIRLVKEHNEINLFALALVPAGSLTKTTDGTPDAFSVRRHFLDGNLHPLYLNINAERCINNLPLANQDAASHGGRVAMPSALGPLAHLAAINAKTTAVTAGPALDTDTALPRTMAEALCLRGDEHTAGSGRPLCSVYVDRAEEAVTGAQLLRRVRRLAYLLRKRNVPVGAAVALLYPPGIDLIVAFQACIYVGAVPFLL